MPHEEMSEQQVAGYLHMDLREVIKLASRGQLPCRKVGGAFRFTKSDLDHWVEQQMHRLPAERLENIEKGVRAHHGYDHEELLAELVPPSGVAVPLQAKTREAVLRALVNLADRAERVYSREDLLREVRERENLCSTGLLPGVAIPHPRHPVPYDIAESFVVVGLTPSGVPFGAEDGTLTRLFFLVCCKDERTHLHVLARLARVLHEAETIDHFLHADSAEELLRSLVSHEHSALGLDEPNGG